jgi:hypothetical protein
MRGSAVPAERSVEEKSGTDEHKEYAKTIALVEVANGPSAKTAKKVPVLHSLLEALADLPPPGERGGLGSTAAQTLCRGRKCGASPVWNVLSGLPFVVALLPAAFFRLVKKAQGEHRR